MTSFEKGGFDTPDSDDFSEQSQEERTIFRRTIDYLKDAKVTVVAALGLVAVNVMYGDSLTVHTSDPLVRQLEMAVPSAFGTPDATGVGALDFGGVTTLTLTTLEVARRTTSLRELAAIAISAQMVSCGTDALIDQTGLIGNTTDVGSSAIAMALGTKFLLDRVVSADSENTRRLWRLGAAAYAAAMTLGAYAFLGGDDGKLDMISHCSALAVGAVAYRLGAWRRDHRKKAPPVIDFGLNPEAA